MGRENRNGIRAPGRLSWQTRQTSGVQESWLSLLESGGREGIRTPGLLVANEALSQLSYSPTSSKEILANVVGVANQCGFVAAQRAKVEITKESEQKQGRSTMLRPDDPLKSGPLREPSSELRLI